MGSIYTTSLPMQIECALELSRRYRVQGDVRRSRKMRRVAHALRMISLRFKRAGKAQKLRYKSNRVKLCANGLLIAPAILTLTGCADKRVELAGRFGLLMLVVLIGIGLAITLVIFLAYLKELRTS